MSARLSILIYHRVLPRPDPLQPDVPDVRLFGRQMLLLKRCFHVLPLSVAVRRLRAGTLPARAACITFDDGYADNLLHALPVLQALDLPACVFVATAYLDGGCMWNDRVIQYVQAAAAGPLDLSALGLGVLPGSTTADKVQAISTLLRRLKYLPWQQRETLTAALALPGAAPLMLSSAGLRALQQAGIEIGAHTERHPILTAVDDATARKEMAGSKYVLEQLLNTPVTLFAYPNGIPDRDFTQHHVRLAADLGFDAAVTTAAGVAGPETDCYRLPRYTPWETDRGRFLFRLLQNHWRGPA